MKFIDLTHKFTNSMPVFPGDTTPELKQTAEVAKDGYGHFHITTGMHVGTHIDGPLHFIAGGKKLSEMPLEKFSGKGILVDARGKMEIGPELLSDLDIDGESIVLVYTGWDKKYRDADYFEVTPVLTEEFGREIIRLGAKMVGMDMSGPDKAPFPVHKILLGAEVLIIENMTQLEKLTDVKEFEVIALPVYFDAEAAPARVIARIL